MAAAAFRFVGAEDLQCGGSRTFHTSKVTERCVVSMSERMSLQRDAGPPVSVHTLQLESQHVSERAHPSFSWKVSHRRMGRAREGRGREGKELSRAKQCPRLASGQGEGQRLTASGQASVYVLRVPLCLSVTQ